MLMNGKIWERKKRKCTEKKELIETPCKIKINIVVEEHVS